MKTKTLLSVIIIGAEKIDPPPLIPQTVDKKLLHIVDLVRD